MAEEPSVARQDSVSSEQAWVNSPAITSADRTGAAGLSSYQAMTLAGISRRAGEGDAEALRLLPTVARFLEAAALEGFAGLGIMPRGRRVTDIWPRLANDR